MSFASYSYVVFLAAAFLLHWLGPQRLRKPILIVASYVFYASWDWRFCSLLFGVSVFSWAWGLLLASKQEATHWLPIGIVVELLPLVFFKYSNFLIANASFLVREAGGSWHPNALAIILPLGISFFTFQGIAYLVDVATGEEPFHRLDDFLLYKGFWPQLIAGPIIRPGEIRDQIMSPRSLSYDNLATGARRILTGLFKKVVLADTAGTVVDMVFMFDARPGFTDALVGVAGFGLQIYFDFGGYCDIAIGSARLFGFRFPENFDWPYSARSPQEFWNRWHMTLSGWIKHYVFTPLLFAVRGKPAWALLCLAVAMALCGFWHGAAWTLVFWGLWHGALLILNHTLLRPLFADLDPARPQSPAWRGIFAHAFTLAAVFAGWSLFRAQSIEQVVDLASAVLTLRGGLRPTLVRENAVFVVGLLVVGLMLVQTLRPMAKDVSTRLAARPVLRTWVTSVVVCTAIILIIAFDRESRAFVYFQF